METSTYSRLDRITITHAKLKVAAAVAYNQNRFPIRATKYWRQQSHGSGSLNLRAQNIGARRIYMGVVAQANSQPDGVSGLPAGGSSNSRKGWIIGVFLSMFLPFMKNKWSPLQLLKSELKTAVETVETVAEVVEKVAEEIEKLADEMADKIPEGEKLKKAAHALENAARETAEVAHKAEELVEKMEKVEEEMQKVDKEKVQVARQHEVLKDVAQPK